MAAATVACGQSPSDGGRDKRLADGGGLFVDHTDLMLADDVGSVLADDVHSVLADYRSCRDHGNRTRAQKLLLRTADAVSKFLPFVTSADPRTQCFRHTAMYLTQLNDFRLWATKSE